jgi:hypothetical protein
MQMVGRFYAECPLEAQLGPAYSIDVPISTDNHIYLVREIDAQSEHSAIAPYVEIVRKALCAKLPTFFTPMESSAENKLTMDGGRPLKSMSAAAG